MIYGYTRVSTKQQSSQLQLNSLKQLNINFENIFTDICSGSKNLIEGKGWNNLMSKVKSGDVIYVWKMDRLSRDHIQSLTVAKELRQRGIIVKSITENYDTTDELVFSILCAVAENERSKISQRIKAGMIASSNKAGRPKTSKDKIKKVKYLIKRHKYSIKDACFQIGISTKTYQRLSKN